MEGEEDQKADEIPYFHKNNRAHTLDLDDLLPPSVAITLSFAPLRSERCFLFW